jgi:hypothetical protein
LTIDPSDGPVFKYLGTTWDIFRKVKKLRPEKKQKCAPTITRHPEQNAPLSTCNLTAKSGTKMEKESEYQA